ncbi:MAG: hypothetical protein F6K30_05600 [Cyanothece sp. SIO2G6]|nr:hypothetical protein [Cyanothece sp. SIO2G6]
MSTVDEKLEILTDQVGRLTEGLMEIKLLIRDQTHALERQVLVAEQQGETIKQQSEAVIRLTQLVETLVQRQMN